MSMTYTYPKSSSTMYNCNDKNYILPTSGVPSNMSVYNATIPDYFDCHNAGYFSTSIEPTNNKGFKTLNPQLAIDHFSPGYQKIDYEGKIVFMDNDPRLYDAKRATITPLDTPPYNGAVKLENVYTDESLKNYGKKYNTYSDINTGSITYYTDDSIEGAFFKPVYTTSAIDLKSLYRDPMGGMKMQYDRFPLKENNCGISKNTNYEYTLSSLDDSMEFREDLMSRQMRKHNQTRWEPAWK